MQRTLLTIALLCFLIAPISAQDTDFTDVIGKTVPEAEAILNQAGFRLAPIILSTPASNDNDNTVIEAISLNEDNLVQVTVARDYNVTLVWENPSGFVRGLTGNELFTFINQTGQELPLRNLEIASFDLTEWQTTLRAGQCAQIWSYNEPETFQAEGCGVIQGGNVAQILDENAQFWIADETFDITQNGIHRARCVVADGHCELWLSPDMYAEDILDYMYLVYDDTQLIVYNNDATRWMDLSQLEINGIGNLSTTRIWDTIAHPDLDRLAPNQCVRFTRNRNSSLLNDCALVATFNTTASEVFWTQAFTVNDTLLSDNALNCPPSLGDVTLCLLKR